MKLFRPRFSLKMMLVAVALVAVGSYLFMLPTVRARRFAELINSKQLEYAAAMLPASMNESSIYRQTLGRAIGAELNPLTLEQLLHGERSVRVRGNLDNSVEDQVLPAGDFAEFIVQWATMSEGAHGFNYW